MHDCEAKKNRLSASTSSSTHVRSELFFIIVVIIIVFILSHLCQHQQACYCWLASTSSMVVECFGKKTASSHQHHRQASLVRGLWAKRRRARAGAEPFFTHRRRSHTEGAGLQTLLGVNWMQPWSSWYSLKVKVRVEI